MTTLSWRSDLPEFLSLPRISAYNLTIFNLNMSVTRVSRELIMNKLTSDSKLHGAGIATVIVWLTFLR